MNAIITDKLLLKWQSKTLCSDYIQWFRWNFLFWASCILKSACFLEFQRSLPGLKQFLVHVFWWKCQESVGEQSSVHPKWPFIGMKMPRFIAWISLRNGWIRYCTKAIEERKKQSPKIRKSEKNVRFFCAPPPLKLFLSFPRLERSGGRGEKSFRQHFTGKSFNKV